MPFRNRREAQLAKLQAMEAELSEHAARLDALERERQTVRNAVESALRILKERSDQPSERLDQAKIELERAEESLAKPAPEPAPRPAPPPRRPPPSAPPVAPSRKRWIGWAIAAAFAASAAALSIEKWRPKHLPEELAGARLGMTRAELVAAVPAAQEEKRGERPAFRTEVLLLDEPATCFFVLLVDERASQVSRNIAEQADADKQRAMVERFADHYEDELGWSTNGQVNGLGGATWRGKGALLNIRDYANWLTIKLEHRDHAPAEEREAERKRTEAERWHIEEGERRRQEERDRIRDQHKDVSEK